jgi:hypothetical protein
MTAPKPKPKPDPEPEPDPPEPGPDDDESPIDKKPAARPAGQNNLTFGQKAVGVSFNPSGNADVDELKRRFALIIDQCHMRRGQLMAGSEAHRLWSIAITEAQTAQMWAVKAATWRD